LHAGDFYGTERNFVNDRYDLRRFLKAQAEVYERKLKAVWDPAKGVK
jgi:hypothetical protein